MVKMDLSNQDLFQSDLSGADLNEADLSNANLTDAILCGVTTHNPEIDKAIKEDCEKRQPEMAKETYGEQ